MASSLTLAKLTTLGAVTQADVDSATARIAAIEAAIDGGSTPSTSKALLGYNDPPQGAYNGVIPHRDLQRGVLGRIEPWKIYAYSPYSLGVGAGEAAGTPGIDLGFTVDDWTMGAAFTVDTPMSSLTLRLEDKYFGTTAHGDGAASTILPGSNPDGYPYWLGNRSRYFGWLDYSGTLNDRVGSPDWIEFASDNVEFWAYANPPAGTALVYTKIYVESGTGELWAGNTPNGNTHARVTKIMEITPSTNGNEINANLAGSGGCWWIRRKPGTTGFKLRRVVRYVKGADVTKIVFDPPWQVPETVAIPLQFPAGSSLGTSGTGISLTGYNQATGAGTLTLTGGNVRYPHGVEWFGINGTFQIPAGGFRYSMPLPNGSKYGTGLMNKLYVDDFNKGGAKTARALDQCGGNSFDRTTPIAGLINPKNAVERAALAEAAGLAQDHIAFALQMTANDRKAFIRTFLNNTTSAIPFMEPGNEVWNPGLESIKANDYLARASGAMDGRYQYADTLHEMLDSIEELKAEGITRQIGIDVCWQTNFAKSLNDFNLIADRKYKGGSGKTLWQRLCEKGVAQPGTAQYMEAWYFGGGAGAIVSPTTITNAVGNGASVAEYTAEIKRQYGLALQAALDGMANMTAAIRAKNQALGFPADAVRSGNYEFNRHPKEDSQLVSGTNLYNAWFAFLDSQDMADMQAALVTGCAARTTGTSNFLNLHYREQYQESGYYGLTPATGVDLVSGARTLAFNAVSTAMTAANQ